MRTKRNILKNKTKECVCMHTHAHNSQQRNKEQLRTLFLEIAICLPDYVFEIKISFTKLLKSITIKSKTTSFLKAYLSTLKQKLFVSMNNIVLPLSIPLYNICHFAFLLSYSSLTCLEIHKQCTSSHTHVLFPGRNHYST